MNHGHRIDYKTLREVNAEAARLAVVEYSNTNGGNRSDAACAFGINRSSVYDILSKQSEGDLKARSRVPKHQRNRTLAEREQKVIEARNKTRFGPKRLSICLRKYEGTGGSAASERMVTSHQPTSSPRRRVSGHP